MKNKMKVKIPPSNGKGGIGTNRTKMNKVIGLNMNKMKV